MSRNTFGELSTNDQLILVDEHDNIIGYESKKRCHEGKGLLHRAFSIFIFNEQKQLLIQKRSAEKLLWPLYWSNSVCSHPRKGETYEKATRRRLQEEIGIGIELRKIFTFQYQTEFEDIGSEYEMCSVYFGKLDGIIQPNPHEIAEWQYMELEVLDRKMQREPHGYTPWFRMEWNRIQQHHYLDINSL